VIFASGICILMTINRNKLKYLRSFPSKIIDQNGLEVSIFAYGSMAGKSKAKVVPMLN
jgi:hypothetical protein